MGLVVTMKKVDEKTIPLEKVFEINDNYKIKENSRNALETIWENFKDSKLNDDIKNKLTEMFKQTISAQK